MLRFCLAIWWGLEAFKIDWISKVPASTLKTLAHAAESQFLGQSKKKISSANASRDIHRGIRRWGLTWKIPYTTFEHTVEDEIGGKHVERVPYISPKDFFQHLVQKTPDLVLGGSPDFEIGRSFLKSFWEKYRLFHPSHRIYHYYPNPDDWAWIVPMCLHGDEGRGLKKGNTCVITLEPNIGLNTYAHAAGRKRPGNGCGCTLEEPCAKRFRLQPGDHYNRELCNCDFLESNLKQHSFLTKFLLCCLPHKVYKLEELLDGLIEKIAEDLSDLFFQGVNSQHGVYRVAVTGWKGDLKWFQRISYLERCFNRVTAINVEMCHECRAGTQQRPFEDIISAIPAWCGTEFTERPWSEDPPYLSIPFDPACPEKILRRDMFHNLRLGLLRDFSGSCIVMLCRMRYFHEDGTGQKNNMPVLLKRAHAQFHFYCRTTSQTAALRSFTKEFLNAKTASKFPWSNSKGSDTALLVKWLHVFTGGLLQNPLDQNDVALLRAMNVAAQHANTCQQQYYSHGIFWTRCCAGAFLKSMEKFLEAYHECARICLSDLRMAGYGIKPKAHMLKHTAVDVATQLAAQHDRITSPILWECSGNEDMIGKVCRLSRRVSAKLTSQRVMDLYLIKSKFLHQRFMQRFWPGLNMEKG